VRERFLLQTHVRMKIRLRCLHGSVPQPERDHGAIRAVLQKVHGCGVTQYVRRDSLLFEVASLCGKMGVLGEETLDRIAAESAATDTRKDRIFGQTVATQANLEALKR